MPKRERLSVRRWYGVSWCAIRRTTSRREQIWRCWAATLRLSVAIRRPLCLPRRPPSKSSKTHANYPNEKQPQSNILEVEIGRAVRVAKLVFDSCLARVDRPANLEKFFVSKSTNRITRSSSERRRKDTADARRPDRVKRPGLRFAFA